ncbi:CsbD family protein [Tessaracoccus sp. OH4464_COT-324]|uniref:CsbD family protein n=1 Tax=Tessaracoccus sp. OH4464_COT-324 TaxID=2491059 RepID=UPI000F62EADF|nr:CsbD family protein [Tessaracoccus sp. OH4464_COT-324]RRD47967.1 CsbD family protein [Tessaracoccus sp. OH4464_COT-324]
MADQDKIANKAEEIIGQAKEGIGKTTGNEQLEAEGKLDQAKAAVKQGVEDIKDKVAETFNKLTDGK